MNEKDNFALVPRPSSAIEKAEPGAKRILTGMVVDLLAQALEDAEVIFQRGRSSYFGNEVPQNHFFAAACFRKAAEMGHPMAQNNLGVCYAAGHGVAQDVAAAVYWYRQAAEQGADRGQFNLAECLADGRGVAQDHRKAFEWFSKAAQNAYAPAITMVGQCFEFGQGLPQDSTEAVRWYRKAEEAGDLKGSLCLVRCILRGKGVAQDFAEVFKLALRIVDEHPGGAFLLGMLYREGKGVQADFAEAYKWFSFAADHGDIDAAKELDLLRTQMNTAEIAEGKRRRENSWRRTLTE